MTTIKGNLVRIKERAIVCACITIENGLIKKVEHISPEPGLPYLLPGFIDAHVHIESSMLVPGEFARLAVVHGTIATISDPHEIANVCGMEGVEFMIRNGQTVPFKFYFGAPSCVPATTFETAGASLNVDDVTTLLNRNDIKYLSEMMNFPGVLQQDRDVMGKIAAAHAAGKPVDGHAPGLRGDAVKQYINAGISTDHECFTAEEALEKLQHGMKILIREGSAAKNFEALASLLHDHAPHMMFCSDDKHPDSLVEGHINQLCARAVSKKIDVFHVLQAACINPVEHYKLDVGLLREGDPADFIMVKDLQYFEVITTYINGEKVAENGRTLIETTQVPNEQIVNQFNCTNKEAAQFVVPYNGEKEIAVMEALDGQLITNRMQVRPKVQGNQIVSDTDNDLLKIVVVNRYHETPVAKAFIKNFGFHKGAIASSVAHDSHNIVAVGADDESICAAVNLVIENKGGVSCVDHTHTHILPLPVAGLMSTSDGYEIAKQYAAIDGAAKALGSALASPFMTLSFMALLVIPHLKLSDKGLFDGDRFAFV